MEQGIIEVRPDLQIFYRDIGSGESVAIIPLACWMGSFEALARECRIVFYDPRGRGQSSAIAVDDASFDADVQDLAAVRRNCGAEQVALLGWSYFGGVVARYAVLYPEQVTRVVIINGLPVRKRPWIDRMEQQAAERTARVDPALVRQMSDSAGPAQFHAFWKIFEATRMGRAPVCKPSARLAEMPNEWPKNALPRDARAIESLGEWDWREDSQRLTMPLLVIQGDADIEPDSAREWAQYAPNARVLMMAGVGHFPFFEDPDRFFGAIQQFLKGEWPSEAEPARGAGTRTDRALRSGVRT
jgi:pimeloyl-ACP methyl ester carboxylesterase